MYDEAVNQQKNDLSVLVGIGRKILILLKCIAGLVCLVLFELSTLFQGFNKLMFEST